MKNLSEKAGLSKPYTNHCLRATCITMLDQHGFEARHIMQVSGHRSESSITNYSRHVSEEKRREMSLAISSTHTATIDEQPVQGQITSDANVNILPDQDTLMSIDAARTSVPATRTSVPAARMSVPATRTSVPAARTSVPAARTSVPATRTSVPATRMSVPAARTSVPAARTSVPATRTSVPAARTSVPAARTSVPAARPSVPAARTSVPAARPSIPATGPPVLLSNQLSPVGFFGSQNSLPPTQPYEDDVDDYFICSQITDVLQDERESATQIQQNNIQPRSPSTSMMNFHHCVVNISYRK